MASAVELSGVYAGRKERSAPGWEALQSSGLAIANSIAVVCDTGERIPRAPPSLGSGNPLRLMDAQADECCVE